MAVFALKRPFFAGFRFWKSCVRLKRTGGSNPLLCAKTPIWGRFFFFTFPFDPPADPLKEQYLQRKATARVIFISLFLLC